MTGAQMLLIKIKLFFLKFYMVQLFRIIIVNYYANVNLAFPYIQCFEIFILTVGTELVS